MSNKAPSMKREKRRVSAYEIVMFSILAIHCLFVLLLFAWAVINSFKEGTDFVANKLGFPKKGWAWENYTTIKDYFFVYDNNNPTYPYAFFDMLMTSLAYAGGSALFQTACTVVAAYCTAKYRGAISDFTFNLVLVTIALPIVGGLASMLQVVEELNLYNTMVGMWIMKFGFNSMYYFIFYAAFKSLSWEYAESAFVDGASHYTVFFRIMLPLVMGLTGTVFLLLFIGYWNDFETPYVFMETPTLAIGLYAVLNGWSVDYTGESVHLTVPQQIVTGLIVFLPIFVVFLVFRNKIMGNLTEGGIKA